jgi:uncharacterized repeat protein (TIGR01451 family)
MRNNIGWKKIEAAALLTMLLFSSCIILKHDTVKADGYTGEDLALAILANQSTLISCSYSDTDNYGNRQSTVLSSMGIMSPTHGSTFALFSTGVAGANPTTSYENNPGDERGSWFSGGQYGYPRDEVTLTMTLQVPEFMHYLYYDVQFFSTEYPEYVGSAYNDKLSVKVNSPSMGLSEYIFDINSGYFVLDSDGLAGTGFNVYAQSGYPGGVDWIDTITRHPGADAGASDLIPIGGQTHPVSPGEQITVTIDLKDVGDNQFDSAAFIDNLMFTGYARANIVARKTVQDLNGGDVERNDLLKYTVTISNTGSAVQHNNIGHEFEDIIPENATYVSGSATATSGTVQYLSNENKIVWDGQISAESSISLSFQVQVNDSADNGVIISNQGFVNWDTDEDYVNDEVELTDDPHTDDGIDLDGDGETDDDDPTELTVVAFTPPTSVSEDFTDDSIGEAATENYMDREWFNTSFEAGETNFGVAGSYYNATPQSFKTKIRAAGSPQYWYYDTAGLESALSFWQISFKCGNASEYSTMYMDFTNSNDAVIAKLKFVYEQQGTHPPLDWLLKLYYWSESSYSWVQLSTDTQGYLYNYWYSLRLELLDQYHIRYSLYRKGTGLVDTKQDESLATLVTEYSPGSDFSNLAYIKWSNTENPIVCPMFFWDDQILGLS